MRRPKRLDFAKIQGRLVQAPCTPEEMEAAWMNVLAIIARMRLRRLAAQGEEQRKG